MRGAVRGFTERRMVKRSIGDLLAFNSRDWAKDKADAWLWGIVHGWDEDDVCGESAMDEVARQHGWSDEDVARLRRLHEAWESI